MDKFAYNVILNVLVVLPRLQTVSHVIQDIIYLAQLAPHVL